MFLLPFLHSSFVVVLRYQQHCSLTVPQTSAITVGSIPRLVSINLHFQNSPLYFLHIITVGYSILLRGVRRRGDHTHRIMGHKGTLKPTAPRGAHRIIGNGGYPRLPRAESLTNELPADNDTTERHSANGTDERTTSRPVPCPAY